MGEGRTGDESDNSTVIDIADAMTLMADLEPASDYEERGERLAEVLSLADALPTRPPKPLKMPRMATVRRIEDE